MLKKTGVFACFLAKVAQNFSVITVTGLFPYLVNKKLRRRPFFRYYSEFRYLGFRYSSRYLYLQTLTLLEVCIFVQPKMFLSGLLAYLSSLRV